MGNHPSEFRRRLGTNKQIHILTDILMLYKIDSYIGAKRFPSQYSHTFKVPYRLKEVTSLSVGVCRQILTFTYIISKLKQYNASLYVFL